MNSKKTKKTKSTFNPVKEEVGDVRAKRVVWTTTDKRRYHLHIL